jgi:hypothetical protein
MTKATDTQSAGETPANIPPATGFNPSGAPEQTVSDVDPSNPSVDADPRANTSVAQNKIDFNDPGLSDSEAVTQALGMKSVADSKAD